MTATFFRFPHTPHIAWMGAIPPREDKVLLQCEVDELLSRDVVVEEKIDGANLGLSLSSAGELQVQNRGGYLVSPYKGQFSRLGEWLAWKEADLRDGLGQSLIAFGEWCAARHTLYYDKLPDWWLLFDVYDRREGRFWSTRRRDQWAAELRLKTVPELQRGRTTMAQLHSRLAHDRSRFGAEHIEGLVVRTQNDDWVVGRGKLVREDFTQAITDHWRSRRIEWNRIGAIAPV